jgi:uncharacterized protein (DUF427 family)
MTAEKSAAESVPKDSRLKKECIWDYPWPPRLEKTIFELKVYNNENLVAATENGFCILETSHPPTYYFPREDVCMDRLSPVAGGSICEYKGRPQYFDIIGSESTVVRGTWSYPTPAVPSSDLANCIAFYAFKTTTCWVGPEKVTAQDGDFYGGWLTSNLVGPYKGGPGTWGW